MTSGPGQFGHWYPTATSVLVWARGRPFIDLPTDVEKVTVVGLHEALPLMGVVGDQAGGKVKRFELPCGGTSPDTGPAEEQIELTVFRSEGRTEAVSVRLVDQLPRPQDVLGGPEEAATEQDEWHRGGNAVDDFLGRHIDLVNDLFDRDQPPMQSGWQGQLGGVAVRPLDAALKLWQQDRDKGQPRRALIVRLAEDETARGLLGDVCQRPRRILARRRQSQKIDRIQEIDPACIRWLVRQPGVSLAQKAGVRQNILSVVRYETADTHENRVVRDLVQRALLACNRYIQENRTYPDSVRVRLVRAFQMELRRFLAQTPIGEVPAAADAPSPNYVLQNDIRYRQLWHWYQLFLRQKKEGDNIWRWQHRVWVEHCQLAIIVCLKNRLDASPLHRADIVVNFEQKSGQYLDNRMSSTLWRLPGHVVVEVVRPDHENWPAEYRQFAPCCPDLLLVKRGLFGGRPSRVQGMWALLDLDVRQDLLESRTAELAKAMGTPTGVPVSAAILQPNRLDHTGSRSHTAGSITGIRLAMGSQEGLQELAAAMRAGLGLG